MESIFIVAEKELKDQITSKRFIAILAIFMLLALYAMVTGMESYNKSLQYYKNDVASDNPYRQETINSMQKQIQDAEARGASAQEIQSLKDSLEYYTNPPMPSVLQVFSSFALLFSILGMILSVSMGFDQVSREKEEGTLKTVLSSPMYRDALINGKSLGAIVTLAIVIAATFLMTIAVMLLYGVVPVADDLLRLAVFFIAALLYCTVFFAIAMLMSTVAKNSAMAVIFTIGIVFLMLIFSILSSLIGVTVAGFVLGPEPDAPVDQMPYIVNTSTTETVVYKNDTAGSMEPVPIPVPTYSPETEKYYNYMNKKFLVSSQISDVLNTVSPIYDFSGFLGFGGNSISGAILSKQKPYDPTSSYWSPYTKTISVWESLSYVWTKVLGLIVEIILAFGLTYVAFMRMDIR
ncbi:putative ABC transporter [Methanocella paludicola SANAE]|uniref:ABC transporter n=1 Tax=Methanocella paludicola (strain DSM 17711 / JCM 13418 / NBRC 101707 / SANAE) TaxID=304371 RepID=D1YX85_METPS|nr:ABC transporter permease subunit [Methanocella paludicola]BAI61057.1 putative ABC transporter [Methanocella paludicola SANAE]